MGQQNGNDFEFGRLMGQLLERSDRQIDLTHRMIDLADKQYEATVRLSETLSGLPHAISDRIVRSDGSVRPSSTIKDLTELVRASAPLVVLALAVAGKTALPQALPLVRDVLAAMAGGG